MKIESIDKVMDDINETREQMQQINEAMGQSAIDLDEDELLGELEELEVSALLLFGGWGGGSLCARVGCARAGLGGARQRHRGPAGAPRCVQSFAPSRAAWVDVVAPLPAGGHECRWWAPPA